MKKLLIALLCLALLALSALAEELAVDVDFTQMDSQSAVNALYDMMDAPAAHQGKTAKLSGTAYRVEGFGDEPAAYYLYMDDPTSCCGGLQIEFVPALTSGGLEGLISDGEEITAIGTLEFGDDEGYVDVRLVNAVVALPTI